MVGMAGFEPTTTTPQCSALPAALHPVYEVLYSLFKLIMFKFNYVGALAFVLFTSHTFCNDNTIETSSIVSGYIKNNVTHWDDIPYAKPVGI